MGFHLQDGDAQFENVDSVVLQKVRQTGNWSSFCFKTVFQPFSGKLVPLGYILVGVFLFFSLFFLIKSNAYVFI